MRFTQQHTHFGHELHESSYTMSHTHLTHITQFDYIRLDNFLVSMQYTGNSGCFPLGKQAAIVRCYQGLFCFSCVQRFRVSVIHRTLTWTTGSLTCVRSYACVYTWGWATPTSQHNILTQKNSHKFVLVLWAGFEPLVMESIGSQGRCSANRGSPSSVLFFKSFYSQIKTHEVKMNAI